MTKTNKRWRVFDRMKRLVRFLNRRAVFFYLGLLSFFFLSVIGGIVLWIADYIVWDIANKPNDKVNLNERSEG